MAISLSITDGTDSVDFNDGTNLYLAEAFQMNIGDGAVSELIISGWLPAIDTDAKAVITKKFNRLIRKAIAHYSERRIDRAVWLVWSTEDETDTKYAKVMGGGEVEVVNHTIGGLRGGRFAPNVIREGAWRSVAPDGTASASIVAATTIYNKSDTDGDNWLDVPNTRTNDVPGLLDLEIDTTTGYTDIIIAMKRGTTTELNNFNPHFNPTDQSTAHGETSDLGAPDNFRVDFTADNTISWDIADTVLQDYVGSYLMYAKIYQSTSNGDIIKARYTDDLQSGEWKTIGAANTDALLYLGTFTIPPTFINPFGSMATTADYTLGIEVDITGTETARIYGFFIVPVDIPPFFVQMTGSVFNDLRINGVNQISYIVDAGTSNQVLDATTTVRGRYLTYHGGTVNRVFFFGWDTSSSNAPYGDYTHNLSPTMALLGVDRFLGLRGNT